MLLLTVPAIVISLFSSCTKSIDESSTEILSSQSAEAVADGNASLSGGGVAAEGSEGEFSTFTFNAVKMPDGSVTGQLIYHLRTNDISVKLDIDCMTIVGNKARLSGTVTKVFGSAEPPANVVVGSRGTFAVQDNGEGSEASPDLFSDLFLTANPQGYLTSLNVNAPTVYIPLKGNIQIKQ